MHALSLALFLALSVAAQDPSPAPAPAPVAGAPAGPNAPNREDAALAPYRKLAETLQSALEEGELEELRPCIDLEALLLQATTGIDPDSKFARGFRDGASGTILPSLIEAVHGQIEAGGSLHFLRLRRHGAERGLLFRLLLSTGAVEYLEFLARSDEAGHARVHDWISFAAGERVSESIHRMFLPLALQQQRGLFDRLLGRDQLVAKHWSEIDQLLTAVREQRAADGLALYASLPEELRHEKFLLLLRLRLAQPLEDTREYQRTLEDFRRYYPDDPATELQSVDYFYMRQEWKRAAEGVRRLRQSVEGDAYLDHLEATLHLQDGAFVRARECAERAVASEPDLIVVHWGLVTVCLRQKDNARVLAALKDIDARFEVQWNDLTQSEEYKEFAASPEHAQWLRYLAAKK